MSREQLALGEPPDVPTLRRFPRWTLAPDRTVWRAHGVGRGPWWFGSALTGRFDLSTPHGTCYLASDPAVALRERFGARLVGTGFVQRARVEDTVVSALRVPVARRLADTRSARAVEFGVTREVDTVVPYGLTQRWAAAWRAAGWHGVRSTPRHTTDPTDVAHALFGPAGEADWPVDPASMTGAQAARLAGLAVVEPPRRPATVPVPWSAADVGSAPAAEPGGA